MTRGYDHFRAAQERAELAQRRHELERQMIVTALGRQRAALSCGAILAAIVREGATWLRPEIDTSRGQWAWQVVQDHLNEFVAAGQLVLEIQSRTGKDGRNHDTRVYQLARRPHV